MTEKNIDRNRAISVVSGIILGLVITQSVFGMVIGAALLFGVYEVGAMIDMMRD